VFNNKCLPVTDQQYVFADAAMEAFVFVETQG
jgi:hypothetical protein